MAGLTYRDIPVPWILYILLHKQKNITKKQSPRQKTLGFACSMLGKSQTYSPQNKKNKKKIHGWILMIYDGFIIIPT